MTISLKPECRFCGTAMTQTLVDLGAMPLANNYITPEALAAGHETSHPLHARVCPSCYLVQVDEPVTAHDIFAEDYAYLSSMSAGWVAHAKAYAEAMITRHELGPDSLVVEIASNDGYLLQHFLARGVPVLGIEPARNVATIANAKGVRTEAMFFDTDAAEGLKARGFSADLMAANNVLAHVPRIGPFMAGFAVLLKQDGVATFEFPHLLKLIAGVQFDTIYHEHFSYLSLGTVQTVAESVGLKIIDVEELPTHGGSLRVFTARADSRHKQSGAVGRILGEEKRARLTSHHGYLGFDAKVAATKHSFLAFLDMAKRRGKTVAAYGAAAKGNTFLNTCGVTASDIVAVFDKAPTKQGKLMPGSHIPIMNPSEIAAIKPDYLVILPWNIAPEVMAQQAGISAWGGRFVTAIPTTKVL
ncbi:MAG: methyltransferase domain-containing protein [Bosea sp. (in: a-proteobacteria)]